VIATNEVVSDPTAWFDVDLYCMNWNGFGGDSAVIDDVHPIGSQIQGATMSNS
jgi:hypothetical protein